MTDARLAAAVEAAAEWLHGFTGDLYGCEGGARYPFGAERAAHQNADRDEVAPLVEAALAAADAWDRERAAPIAGCWCVTCATQSLGLSPWSSTMIRGMVTCPDCGNKRCPKATHHDNACTRSNEPGQEGSFYGPPPDERREPRPVPR